MSEIFTKLTGSVYGDATFLFFVFIVIFVATMYFGRNRVAAIVLAFYPALFVYENLPFLKQLLVMKGDNGLLINKLIVFLIIMTLAYIITRRYLELFNGSSGVVSKIGLSLSVLIIFLLFSYNVVNFDAFHNFSDSTDALFAGGDRLFWLGIAPLVLLAFV